MLGYLPGNALSVLKFDDNGDPSVLELYPLTVRGTLVKSKKGGNSNSGDSKAQNPKVRKRRRVGSQRGGGNWNVSSNDSEGWSTTEEETGMVVVPMPTIHWLVSPHWNRVVSTLEDKVRDGSVMSGRRVDRVARSLCMADPLCSSQYNGVQFLTDVFQRDGFMVRLAESHKQALKRTEELLKMGGDYEEAVTKRNWFPSTRGVGGMNVKNVGLRCLHMHLGEWFATGTHEVGRMVEEWGTWEVEGRGDEWMEKWKEVGGGGGET